MRSAVPDVDRDTSHMAAHVVNSPLCLHDILLTMRMHIFLVARISTTHTKKSRVQATMFLTA